MGNTSNEFIIHQATGTITYNYELLCKYHVLTEMIREAPVSGPNRALLGDDFFKKMNIRTDKIQNSEYSSFVFQHSASKEILEVIDFSRFDTEGFVLYNTLRQIIKKFIEHEYSMFFIRVDDYLNTSDAEANKRDLAAAEFAYNNLKDLRNFLLMREANLDNVGIVFDLRDDEGKKRKDCQVTIGDKTAKLAIINKQIEEVMSIVHYLDNEYLPSYRFAGVKNADLTSSFVSEMFEPVRRIIELEGKQSSSKRIFKGLVIKVVQDFVKNEGMHFRDGEIDEREQRLIAYDLLMKSGFIDIQLISSHKNRDSRIKYMESIPPYKDDYRDIKYTPL